jgi:hypothetical protein
VPVGYKSIETTGQVIKQLTAKGSKSERQAPMLATKDGTYILRRRGGNPFIADPELEKLVGQTIHCKGVLNEHTLIMSSWDVQ